MQVEPPTELTKLDTSELGLQSLLPIHLTLSIYHTPLERGFLVSVQRLSSLQDSILVAMQCAKKKENKNPRCSDLTQESCIIPCLRTWAHLHDQAEHLVKAYIKVEF